MAWRWLQRLWRPYVEVPELGLLAAGTDRRVEIEGRIEALELLRDPLANEFGVALEYHAWPPATTMGIDGGSSHSSRAFQVNARQALDFVLCEGAARVLIRTDPGEDVMALHDNLLRRYGVGLRAETELVEAGQRLKIAGVVEYRSAGAGTPHRELPYGAIVRAERIRLI